MDSDKEIEMEFEPIYEKLSCSLKRKNFFDQIKIDCKTEVDAQNILSVLNVSSWAFISEYKCENGQINYGGKANFYISFTDIENKLKKCECAVEFKGNIKDDCILENDKLIIDGIVEKCSFDLTGAFLSVEGYVSVKAEVNSFTQANALVGGENLVVDEREFSFLKTSGIRKTTYPLEEEFILNYPVLEVLNHRADAIITAVQCGVGCIIVDGEVLFKAIMLQKNDNNDIIKESFTLPFRVEIECEECMPSMQSIARVKERAFKVDITVDTEKNQSTMRVNVNLVFQGEAFYFENILLAQDIFSTQKEIELSHSNIDYSVVKEMKYCSLNIVNRVGLEENAQDCMLLSTFNEQCEVLKIEKESEGAKISGAITLTLILKDNQGKVFTSRIETPFEREVDLEFDNNLDISQIARVKKCKARIISKEEIEVDCDLYFTFYPEEKNQIRVIDSVKIVGDKEMPTSAISVYIPTSGEELWSLAKKLNICPTALIETNKELQFPLNGNERIVVYRQK